MPLDLTQDYKFVDGTETVTHHHKDAAGDTCNDVAYALAQPVRVQESSGAWVISSSHMLWILPGPELTDRPKIGDSLHRYQDDTRWNIQDVNHDELTDTYECNAVKSR